MNLTPIDKLSRGVAANVIEGHVLQDRFGPGIIDDLIAAGVVGRDFWAYFLSVGKDHDRVRDGVQDGSARTWVLTRNVNLIRNIWERSDYRCSRWYRDSDNGRRFLVMLRSYLDLLAEHFPEEARALAAEFIRDARRSARSA